MPRLEKLTEMLMKSPEDPFLHFARAMELVKLGRLDDAVADFDRAIGLSPTDPAAYYHKANALIALQRLDDARRVLLKGRDVAEAVGNTHARGEMQALLDGIGS